VSVARLDAAGARVAVRHGCWRDTPVGSCCCPAIRRGPVQAEHAQPGQVDRGSEQAEVGGDLDTAADPHPAAAVAAADQMGQLALHLGTGRAVVGGAIGIGLAGASSR
jgi:hypothetical protein